ncbi:MAG: hypothetical protein ABEJ23_03645 [Haloarculaceae archaeon]
MAAWPDRAWLSWDRLVDAGAILAVGAILVAIHAITTPAERRALALSHRTLQPVALLTAAYVHAGWEHLWVNVLSYVAGAGFAAYLCRLSGERRWFWRTHLAFLLVLPVLVNLTDFAVFAVLYPSVERASLGFSGVVAGFGGYVFVIFLVLLGRVYSRDAVLFAGEFLLVVLAAEVYLIYADGFSVVGIGIVLTGLLATALALLWQGTRSGYLRDRENWPELGFYLADGAAILLVLTGYVVGMFPAQLVQDGAFANIFAHAAGFAWGGVLALLTWRLG